MNGLFSFNLLMLIDKSRKTIMKVLIFFLTMLPLFSVNANDITGSWYGLLDVQGVKLNISFHIDEQDGALTSTMDSPDQGAIGIATSKTTFKDNKLKIIMAIMGVKFTGKLANNQLSGYFSQSGMKLPLTLTKSSGAVEPDDVVTSIKTDITGTWYGQFDIPENPLKIVFHISKKDGVYISEMDSPDESVKSMKATSTGFKNNRLKIVLKNIGAEYNAALIGDQLIGTYRQRGAMVPLKLNRDPNQLQSRKKRPQDPVEPLPYESRDVHFSNQQADGIVLAGTLTLPKHIDKPPVVILISGSGPQNRDEELFGHRPFSVWADYLTRHGIAVLRYDDRGVGQSEGTQKDATSFDFSTDVEAAVEYLQSRNDIDSGKIGLMGHSEGGFIAPMVAARNKNVAFIILLAATGVIGADVMYAQSQRIVELAGMDDEMVEANQKIIAQAHQIIKHHYHSPELKSMLEKHLRNMRKSVPEPLAAELTDDKLAIEVQKLTSSWYHYFLTTDPDQFLSQVSCPILAINGSLDVQVLADLNLEGIQKSLLKADNQDVTIKKLDGLNHLLQTAKTGSILEYQIIEETVAPAVLAVVADWTNQRFGSTK